MSVSSHSHLAFLCLSLRHGVPGNQLSACTGRILQGRFSGLLSGVLAVPLQHLYVVFHSPGVHKDVIEIGENLARVQASQHHLNKPGVCLGRITQAERHAPELLLSPWSQKSYQRPVTFADTEVIVCTSAVNGTKEPVFP